MVDEFAGEMRRAITAKTITVEELNEIVDSILALTIGEGIINLYTDNIMEILNFFYKQKSAPATRAPVSAYIRMLHSITHQELDELEELLTRNIELLVHAKLGASADEAISIMVPDHYGYLYKDTKAGDVSLATTIVRQPYVFLCFSVIMVGTEYFINSFELKERE